MARKRNSSSSTARKRNSSSLADPVVAARLKEIRVSHGMTLEELADGLSPYVPESKKDGKVSKGKVSKGMISRWENGSAAPVNKYLSAYARFFNIDMNEILGLAIPYDKAILAANIQRYADDPHIGLWKLGNAAGVDPLTVSAWAQGLCSPSDKNIRRIAHYLGVSIPELTGIPTVYDYSVLAQLSRALESNPKRKELFELTEGLSDENIDALITIIKGMKGT